MNRRNFIMSLLALPVFSIGGNIDRSEPRKTRLQLLKETTEWGTYGKGGYAHCKGTCPEHQLRWVRLVDCETEHLQAILRMPSLSCDHEILVESILEDRGV